MDHHHQKQQKSYPLVPSEYRLVDEIGHGGSATVYEAKCLPLEETVAIKSIDLERLNATLDDVRREAQMMSLIDHPNVLRAHCSFIVQQSLWVVMPYMAGGSCLSIMKTSFPNGFEEPVIALVLKETLKALEYLHQQGHLHRDVKAGNILIGSRGGVKVGDFGVSACVFESRDGQRMKRNTFVGTPCWMAPEVIDHGNGYDHKADIWSFGITALELAHGHAPLSKLPPIKALLMQLQGAPPGLDYETDKKFSRSFREMVGLCLVKDPGRRPSAEKLLKHSFFRHTKSPDYIVKHVLENLPSLVERVRSIRAKESLMGQEEEEDEDGHMGVHHHVRMRRISGWNFNEDTLKFEPMYRMDENARICYSEIVDRRSKTSKGRENLNSNAQVDAKIDCIPELKNTQVGSETKCVPDPKHTQVDSDTNSVPEPKKTQVASEANCVPEPKNTQVDSETICVPKPKNTKVDSESTCVLGPKNSAQVASETNCMPVEAGSIIGSEHNPHTDTESSSMSDTGNNSGDVDCSEDHQGLDVAQGLKHCEAANPNPSSFPGSKENAVLKSSSDAESMGGSMKVLSESKECGHLENENLKGISNKNQGADLKALSEKSQRREKEGLLHSDEKQHPRGISDKKDCNHLEGLSEKFQPATDKSANGTEHNCKGQVGHGLKPMVVQKKGRFSVTKEDGANTNKPIVHPPQPLRRIHSLSSQTSLSSILQGGLPSPTIQSPAPQLLHDFNSHSIPTPALLPLLHNLLQSTNTQHDMLILLLNTIGGDHMGSSLSSPSSQANGMAMRHKMAWERESELVQQISDLQGKMSTLSDELHIIKGKNAQMEHELNAIYIKEEEGWIRKEEAEQSEN